MESRYVFYDTDETGRLEYDIEGDFYKQLIRVCCENSAFFSCLVFDSTPSLLQELESFRLPKNPAVVFAYEHYSKIIRSNEAQIRFYRVCPALCELLLSKTQSIFTWSSLLGFHAPDDPTFYRSDGSLFFSSVIHEGECELTPRDGEDVSSIVLADMRWKKE